MDSLTQYLFKPTVDVARELSVLPEQEQIETVRRMLLFSRSTYEVAKEVMPSLGLDARLDLLELACRDEPSFDSYVKTRIAAATFAKRGGPLTVEIVQALKDLNVERGDWATFMRGDPVTFRLPTSDQDTVGFLVLREDRLGSGIFLIHNPGNGLQSFSDFRDRSMRLAHALGKNEIELMGASITNERLGRMLVRQGFELSTVDLPEDYGGGQVEILSKRFPVRVPS